MRGRARATRQGRGASTDWRRERRSSQVHAGALLRADPGPWLPEPPHLGRGTSPGAPAAAGGSPPLRRTGRRPPADAISLGGAALRQQPHPLGCEGDDRRGGLRASSQVQGASFVWLLEGSLGAAAINWMHRGACGVIRASFAQHRAARQVQAAWDSQSAAHLLAAASLTGMQHGSLPAWCGLSG